MAGNMLTAASVLQCPHGGAVVIGAVGPTTAAGAPIATIADVYAVAGCTLVVNPCVTVQWMVPDIKTRTSRGPTLSQSSVGVCLSALGVPNGPVVIQSTQPKVSSL